MFHKPYKDHNPTIIVESLDRVNKELEKGQYFFSDIKKEGVLLFKEEGFELKEAKELSNQEIKEIAQSDFDQWFEKGGNCIKTSKYHIQENMLSEAAFQLHQATENFLNCSLLVLISYKPKSHNLKTLLSLCSSQSNQFLNIFPTGNKEQEDCFELLRKAYIEARYEKDYKITLDQLNYLIEKLEKLEEITGQVCKERISSLNLKRL